MTDSFHKTMYKLHKNVEQHISRGSEGTRDLEVPEAGPH